MLTPTEGLETASSSASCRGGPLTAARETPVLLVGVYSLNTTEDFGVLLHSGIWSSSTGERFRHSLSCSLLRANLRGNHQSLTAAMRLRGHAANKNSLRHLIFNKDHGKACSSC